MNTSHSQALETATKYYYWKPMAAFFRSLEINMYYDSGVVLSSPTLDLGCGDGGVVHMLKEIALVKESPYGIDNSYRELRKAMVINEHLSLLQADANDLPFKDEAFSSIICNGVLCSIPEGVERSVKEISRLLKNGGIVVVTVPTDKFMEVLVLPKILKRISQGLGMLYINRLSKRLPHFSAYSPREWEGIFEKNGLTVLKSKHFFSPQAGSVWNILSLQFFRIFGLLKLIRNREVIGFTCDILQKIFRKIYHGNSDKSIFGYLFIIGQKR